MPLPRPSTNLQDDEREVHLVALLEQCEACMRADGSQSHRMIEGSRAQALAPQTPTCCNAAAAAAARWGYSCK